MSFEVQKFFTLMKPNLSTFFLATFAFNVIPKKSLSNHRSQGIIVSSKSFTVFVLTFRSYGPF